VPNRAIFLWIKIAQRAKRSAGALDSNLQLAAPRRHERWSSSAIGVKPRQTDQSYPTDPTDPTDSGNPPSFAEATEGRKSAIRNSQFAIHLIPLGSTSRPPGRWQNEKNSI
jgi:hypothetical protein